MAEFPSTVKVGPYDYTVMRSYERIANHRKESNLIVARIDFHSHVIDVDPSLERGRQTVNLFHELLHAAWDMVRMDDVDLTEEKVITRLSPALVAILRDNPALVACLTEA